MAKNTGIPYELLTQVIFQEIVDQTSVKNIEVKHNVFIQGKTLKHQIDVYCEFELNGIVYKTIIQAKDWNSSVSQEKLLAFKSILEDIPGQPRGIFVTKKGYQKGAKEYADANEILIYELREPTEKDWEGRVKEIHFTIDAYFPHSRITQIVLDEEWAKGKIDKEKYPDGIEFKISGKPEDIILYDSEGKESSNFGIETLKLYPEGLEIIPETKKQVVFEKEYFVETGVCEFPLIKLLGYEVIYSVSNHKDEIIIDYSEIVGFILKNTITKEIKVIKKDLKLSE